MKPLPQKSWLQLKRAIKTIRRRAPTKRYLLEAQKELSYALEHPNLTDGVGTGTLQRLAMAIHTARANNHYDGITEILLAELEPKSKKKR